MRKLQTKILIKPLAKSANYHEEYVSLCENDILSLFYANIRYLNLLREVTNSSIYLIEARINEKLVGALPFAVKQGSLGAVHNSLPFFGSNGGVIGSFGNEEVSRELVRAFFDHAERSGSTSATLITNPLTSTKTNYELFDEFTHVESRISLITHLDRLRPGESLIDHFDEPRPRNIRKAIREGITVKIESQECLNFLYETHTDNMQSIGGATKPIEFFELLNKLLAHSDWKIYTAYKNQSRIAALLVFFHNKTVEYFIPAIESESRPMQPLSLIIYHAMQDAKSKGYTNWNWGGTWDSQKGVYDFKKRWFTTEYRYYYLTKVFDLMLYEKSQEIITREYPNYFVIPFKALNKNGEK